jgi:release factor glutamine methyltransferase
MRKTLQKEFSNKLSAKRSKAAGSAECPPAMDQSSRQMDAKSHALIVLGTTLRSRGYRFVAVAPATHYRVLDRPGNPTTLESIFGWNRPFECKGLDSKILALLEKAEALDEEGGKCRSRVRFATIGDLLFVHSGFPTTEQDAVFFGPDTYRFVRLLNASLADIDVSRSLRLIDIGCGAGAGGIYAALRRPAPTELILSDINPKALFFSAINAVLNDLPFAKTLLSDVLDGVDGPADVIIANPPYLVDEDRRLYRHGGGGLGIALALRIAEQSLARLAPGGRLILYSGTPIIGGADPFFESLHPLLQLHTNQYSYEEIDPDVFGDELERFAYANADRIAVVGLTAIKQG